MRDPLACDKEVEDGMLLDVVDGLLVSHHGEVVAIALQYLVVNAQSCTSSCTPVMDLSAIDAIVCITLRTLHEILVNTASNFETAFKDLSAMFIQSCLLLQGDGNAEALHGSAGLVRKCCRRHCWRSLRRPVPYTSALPPFTQKLPAEIKVCEVICEGECEETHSGSEGECEETHSGSESERGDALWQ